MTEVDVKYKTLSFASNLKYLLLKEGEGGGSVGWETKRK